MTIDALMTVEVQGVPHNKERLKRLIACVEKEGAAAYGVRKDWLQRAKAALEKSGEEDVHR